ncbi:ATP-binding protein [Rugamonas apoptosis]|uniref:ATP-binding protein n=1 Tax=Rugamonas apoptosis TaxID=2758570 RepID=A0A7W2IJ90_9BURK|nr:ATP-binding protein [Rugamonas apoptosis]MBA5686313.1 ATP-binding protein [Rugamonas apoptosis]
MVRKNHAGDASIPQVPQVGLGGVRPRAAQYYELGVPGYENPLIQTLGPLYSLEEIGLKMQVVRPYSDEQRFQSNPQRLANISLLGLGYVPISIQAEMGRKFGEVLRNGYVHRPLIKIRQEVGGKHLEPALDHTPVISNTTFFGVSGMGKSRTMDRVLANYPQVWWHPEYRTLQVVWVRVETPDDGSTKSLIRAVHRALDRVLGENVAREIERKKYVRHDAMAELITRIESVHLGAIILDELQHAKKSSKEASDNLASFLVSFINEVRIPVVMIGTAECFDMLSVSFRAARRSIGEIIFSCPPGPEFDHFVSSFFRYQYLRVETPLTEKLIAKFFVRSQGILALAVVLYQLAQKRAIDCGDEVITEDLLDEIANEHFKICQPVLDAIATRNISQLKRASDMFSRQIGFLQEAVL